MNFLGLNGRVSILFEFQPVNRPTATLSRKIGKGKFHHSEPLAVFSTSEQIVGIVTILVSPGKQVEHLGIKVEAISQIESRSDRNPPYKLSTMVKELETPGLLIGNKQYNVVLNPTDVTCESYDGHNFSISVTSKEFDYIVRIVSPLTGLNPSLKMEVGIEDCLHIEFEYDKSKYHLEDVVIGKLHFLLIRIKLKSVELGIIQRETCGPENGSHSHSETIVKYEVMEGSPAKGECIPLRVFLKPYTLSPTYNKVNNKCSVKYFFNLVLIDEENRRYFKQQEVQLYRNKLI